MPGFGNSCGNTAATNVPAFSFAGKRSFRAPLEQGCKTASAASVASIRSSQPSRSPIPAKQLDLLQHGLLGLLLAHHRVPAYATPAISYSGDGTVGYP